MTSVRKRYSTSEDACRELLVPAEQFNQSRAVIESGLLRNEPMIPMPEYESWLQQYSVQFMSLMGYSGDLQKIHFRNDNTPSAFATGQNVILHTGVLEWYVHPKDALMKLGFDEEQASAYLDAIQSSNPGWNGLIAVFAHETAHNVLGHPDARPTAEACNDYIESKRREIGGYEELVATGRQSNGGLRSFGAIVKDTLLSNLELQQEESDADELGAWFAWKATGDPFIMAKTLKWLSLYPGLLNNVTGIGAAIKEVLCSNHPALVERVDQASSVGYLFGTTEQPRKELLQLPQDAIKQRYLWLIDWYPKQLAYIERLSDGNLTSEERDERRRVEIEAKPSDSALIVDGEIMPKQKIKMWLSLGPHIIASQHKKVTREQRIVVLEDGPDKFKVDARRE